MEGSVYNKKMNYYFKMTRKYNKKGHYMIVEQNCLIMNCKLDSNDNSFKSTSEKQKLLLELLAKILQMKYIHLKIWQKCQSSRSNYSV